MPDNHEDNYAEYYYIDSDLSNSVVESNNDSRNTDMNFSDLLDELNTIKKSIESIQNELAERPFFGIFSKQIWGKIKSNNQARVCFTWICLICFLFIVGTFTIRCCKFIWNQSDSGFIEATAEAAKHLPKVKN